jgi:hypothetical protein
MRFIKAGPVSRTMSDAPKPRPTEEILSRRRLKLFVLVLLVEYAIFFAGLLTPLPASTSRVLANQTSSQLSPVLNETIPQQVGYIFFHNLSIALAEMIPVAGALLFAFSMFTTGLVTQALLVAKGDPAALGAAILVFPYALVELSAYSLAVVSGSLLLVGWRRGRLREELKVFGVEALAVAGLLIVAAAMEVTTVSISALVGLALWLPTGLGIVGVAIAAERRRA